MWFHCFNFILYFEQKQIVFLQVIQVSFKKCERLHGQLATTELMHMLFQPLDGSNHTFATKFNGSQHNESEHKKDCQIIELIPHIGWVLLLSLDSFSCIKSTLEYNPLYLYLIWNWVNRRILFVFYFIISVFLCLSSWCSNYFNKIIKQICEHAYSIVFFV